MGMVGIHTDLRTITTGILVTGIINQHRCTVIGSDWSSVASGEGGADIRDMDIMAATDVIIPGITIIDGSHTYFFRKPCTYRAGFFTFYKDLVLWYVIALGAF